MFDSNWFTKYFSSKWRPKWHKLVQTIHGNPFIMWVFFQTLSLKSVFIFGFLHSFPFEWHVATARIADLFNPAFRICYLIPLSYTQRKLITFDHLSKLRGIFGKLCKLRGKIVCKSRDNFLCPAIKIDSCWCGIFA